MTGERRLRPWFPADAPTLVAAWSDPEIARWNPVPAERSIADAEAWIIRAAQRPPDSPVRDLVMVNESDEVLGELGLRVSAERRVAEAGFWIAPAYRRQGEGKRLLRLASGVADELDLRGLISVSDAANEGAISLLRSAGWWEVRARSGHRAFVDRQI